MKIRTLFFVAQACFAVWVKTSSRWKVLRKECLAFGRTKWNFSPCECGWRDIRLAATCEFSFHPGKFAFRVLLLKCGEMVFTRKRYSFLSYVIETRMNHPRRQKIGRICFKSFKIYLQQLRQPDHDRLNKNLLKMLQEDFGRVESSSDGDIWDEKSRTWDPDLPFNEQLNETSLLELSSRLLYRTYKL